MSQETPSTPTIPTAADQPNRWRNIWTKIARPKPVGVHCEYCGWQGQRADVLKAPRLNEDGVVYQIDTCPGCMRNGGLVFYS